MDDLDAKNPIRQARETLGLSRREFAQVLELSYERIAAAELGHIRQLPRGWQVALAQAGFQDFEELAAQYDRWRQNQAAALVPSHRSQ